MQASSRFRGGNILLSAKVAARTITAIAKSRELHFPDLNRLTVENIVL
jgi:hypothetical protein